MPILAVEPHHICPFTGLPCNCHWGRPLFHRLASQAVRQIRNQNQKVFRDEEGQKYLEGLEQIAAEHPGVEPMIAWMAQQYKKGRMRLHPDPGRGELQFRPHDDDPEYFRNVGANLLSWIQWMGARQHPLRRGVNIMELSPQDVNSRSHQLREELAEKANKESWFRNYPNAQGHHVHTFTPDDLNRLSDDIPGHLDSEELQQLLNDHAGWKVVQLDGDAAKGESGALGHCIGRDDMPYHHCIENDIIEAYSLRDPSGYPRLTWHYNPDGTFAHVQGKGTEKQEWRDLASIFNDIHGKDDDDGGSGSEDSLNEYVEEPEDEYDEEINLPRPETPQQYLDQYHPRTENLHELAGEHADYGVGDYTQINRGDPYWDNDMYDALREEEDPEERHNFYHTIFHNANYGHHEEWNNYMNDVRATPDEELDDKDHMLLNEWRQAYNKQFDQQGRFRPPTYNYTTDTWQSIWNAANKPLWEENSQGWVRPEGQEFFQNPTYFYRSPQNQVTPPASGGYFDRQANILDPIHDTLSPLVWDHPGNPRPHLKDQHRKWIIREIYALAAKFEPSPDSWLTIVLTGSLTTFQYSDSSDCDVSLFVNPSTLPEWDRAKLIGMMIEHMDGTPLPGTPFQMQCFVVARNISTADLYQPGLRSGYNILQGTWIVPPDKSRIHDVQREQNSDYVYALESADKMERLLRYEPDKAVQYWHQIHKRRMRDQRAGKGDFSQANIVYKFLANRGLFPQIAQASGEYIA